MSNATDRSASPAPAGPRLTPERVWQERGSVLALFAPIPPATVSFHAVATVHPAGSVDRASVPKKLAKLLPKDASTGCLIELAPTDGSSPTASGCRCSAWPPRRRPGPTFR